MSLTRNNHCKQRAVRRQLFPEKLWDLVNRPSSGIQWSPDGKRIEVERTQLEKLIGTKFRSHNFDSFIRQLHFYGFRKCGNSYHHDKFQRGQPEALLTMKRKYSSLTLGTLCNANSGSPYHTSQASNTSSNDSTISNTGSNACGSGSGVGGVGIIHEGAGGNNNNATPKAAPSNDYAIDYSITKQKLNTSGTKSPSKSLSKQQQQQKQHTLLQSSTSTKKDGAEEITLYALKPIESLEIPVQTTSANLLSTFTNIREESVTADSKDNSIKITIPEIMKDTGKTAWPQSLVLENYWNGNQNILSAYFIYKTNESHEMN